MIVTDASVIVTALADDGIDGAAARSRLAGEELLAPHLIDIEVLSAWRRIVAAGQMSENRAIQAIADLRDLRVRRVPHEPLLNRCWQLPNNLSTYDACYVALAEASEATLVTADAHIAAAPGPRCKIEVLSSAAQQPRFRPPVSGAERDATRTAEVASPGEQLGK